MRRARDLRAIGGVLPQELEQFGPLNHRVHMARDLLSLG